MLSQTTMESDYSIASIDRATAQKILPLFLNKGSFSINKNPAPTREQILQNELDRLGTDELSAEEELSALIKAGTYRDGNRIARNFETGVLSIDLQPSDGEPGCITAIKPAKLSKSGYLLAFVILSEVSIQKKSANLRIPKIKIVKKYLNRDPSEKQVYQDIWECLKSLMRVDYLIYGYSFTTDSVKRAQGRPKAIGSFIYDVQQDHKNYILSVNPNFVGCVQFLFQGDKSRFKKEKKELFGGRGYYSFPTSALPLSARYSNTALHLIHTLIRERGNKHLNGKDFKVIAFKIRYWMERLTINYSRIDHRYREFLRAIKEVEIIDKMEPCIEELEAMKPSRALDEMLYIRIDKSIKALNVEITERLALKSNLLVTKQGKK
ncbi:MAG: hypothetical protein GF393_12955 [Armatimonadia bacterium]|nr:hypothetical protein [Armatimonadia bacterium]